MLRRPAKSLLSLRCLLLILSAEPCLAATEALPPHAGPCAVGEPPPAAAVSVAAEEVLQVPGVLRQALRSSVLRVATDSGSGTGFIISPRGLVLTALHVVEGAAAISVQWPDGRTVRARLRRSLPQLDLAVLKLPEGDYAPLPLGDSDRIAPGHTVIAAGYPPAGGLSVEPCRVTTLPSYRQTPLIEVDNSLPPGYSGGPLLTRQGEVIGIVFSRCLPERAALTLSIPSNHARRRIGTEQTLH